MYKLYVLHYNTVVHIKIFPKIMQKHYRCEIHRVANY